MPIFPFFQYPYNNRYYPRYNYNNRNYMHNSNSINSEKKDTSHANENDTYNNDIDEKTQKNKSSRYSGFGPIHFQNPFELDSEQPVLEILGISLYLDDLIILGLLFFLYKEGVKDDMLFLSLILLLLS